MRSEDIARLAGVSRSTVSRVLNNYSDIPQRTKDKVMRIIQQHHYEPHTSARVLAGKGTDTIGLFVVSMAERKAGNRIYQNHYFAPIVDTVIDTANAAGYYVLVHTVYSEDDYLKIKQAYLQRRIDAGIIVGTQKDIERVADICRIDKPLVLVDYDTEELIGQELHRDGLFVVNSDDYEGACQAMRYLIGLGHRTIGHIQGRMNTYSGRQRYMAYVDMMTEHGLPIDEAVILPGEFLKEKAYEETARMLKRRTAPSALFAANDDMALAAMQALKDNGLQVPDHVSVVGFDDIPIVSQLQPALTSVRLPIIDMSQRAVKQLIAICAGSACSFAHVTLPTRLVVRDSCRRYEP